MWLISDKKEDEKDALRHQLYCINKMLEDTTIIDIRLTQISDKEKQEEAHAALVKLENILFDMRTQTVNKMKVSRQ